MLLFVYWSEISFLSSYFCRRWNSSCLLSRRRHQSFSKHHNSFIPRFHWLQNIMHFGIYFGRNSEISKFYWMLINFLSLKIKLSFGHIFYPCNCYCQSYGFFLLGFFPIKKSHAHYLIRSEVTQHKINFVKNCPQWGLNQQPSDHQSHALPTELSHYLVVCMKVVQDGRTGAYTPCESLMSLESHALLILKLNNVQHEKLCMKQKESSLQKSPTYSCLAQLTEHATDDPEVVTSNPSGGNFWQNLFCSVFISRISRAWLYKGLDDSYPQANRT